jgi:hypothetical protein
MIPAFVGLLVGIGTTIVMPLLYRWRWGGTK